jgi:hypothetical protein
MTKRAQIFIAATILSGCLLLTSSLWEERLFAPSNAYLAYCFLALMGSGLKVRLPGITGTISVNFVFVLISVAVFTFSETVLLAASACIVQCLWKCRRRPRLIQVSFNVATLAVSSGAAYRVSHLLAGHAEVNLAVLLAVATCFYFTANTMLISGVMALVEGKRLLKVWQQCYIWSLPYYLVGALIAGLVVSTGKSMGWQASLVMLPLTYLVYLFYRLCTERIVGLQLATTE